MHSKSADWNSLSNITITVLSEIQNLSLLYKKKGRVFYQNVENGKEDRSSLYPNAVGT